MKNVYLLVIVFISGASVLAVEILGTRVLGPFYGVSLFLWSALITVTLLALSIGYAVGGRWADRGPDISRLCMLLIIAGLMIGLIPLLKHPMQNLPNTFGLRLSVLIASMILFAPPLTLLGMVSPYAIRLRTSHLQEVGRTAGNLYAISTVGSIVAALLTGFFLIPNIGVNLLLFSICATLVITGAIGILRKKPVAIMLALFALVVIFFFHSRLDNRLYPEAKSIAFAESPYAEIEVIDVANKRYLIIDGGVHTIIDAATGESYYPYVAVTDILKDFFQAPGEMLLVGLGGGSVMKSYANSGWAVESVEIDPVVTAMAKAYFHLRDDEGPVHHTDGRQFLITNEKKYDIIMLDAFGSSSIPFHLVTREAFATVAERMHPNAVLAMNIETKSWNDEFLLSLAATLKHTFSEIMVLPAHKNPEGLGNLIVLAANRPFVSDRGYSYEELAPPGYLLSMDYRRDFAWEKRFIPNSETGFVLTDDLNPVDLWSEAINNLAREDLHEFFYQQLNH